VRHSGSQIWAICGCGGDVKGVIRQPARESVFFAAQALTQA